jgi:hypothetical protein
MSDQSPWNTTPTPSRTPSRRNTGAGAGAGCAAVVLVLLLGGAVYGIANMNSGGSSGGAADPQDSYSYSAPAPAPQTSVQDIEAGDCVTTGDSSLPTDGSTVDISDITEVSCSDPSAQYKVIGVEPLTTDMNSCATDYPDYTAALLDQSEFFSTVYCVVQNS